MSGLIVHPPRSLGTYQYVLYDLHTPLQVLCTPHSREHIYLPSRALEVRDLARAGEYSRARSHVSD